MIFFYTQNYESMNIKLVYKQYLYTKAYFRYVDTFIIFKSIKRQAEVMVNNINSATKKSNL